MAAAKRSAKIVWEGDLLNGKGNVKLGSNSLPEFPVTWASRAEESSGGKTSPEELLAAAQAACFSMAFSAQLARNRTPPQRLEVNAECTFDKVGDAYKVTKMEIKVRGKVPNIEKAKFEELAKGAAASCPISSALKGNVQIDETAVLE
jgi:osmotically inducible protein OsmC